MLICCTGGRAYRDADLVADVLHHWRERFYSERERGVGERFTVIVGDNKDGLDMIVREWCEANSVSYLVGVALWTRLGLAAGPQRNAAMLDAKPDAVLAFPGKKGTAHCKSLAQSRGLPVYEIRSRQEWEARLLNA